jgi:hypothetical protein
MHIRSAAQWTGAMRGPAFFVSRRPALANSPPLARAPHLRRMRSVFVPRGRAEPPATRIATRRLPSFRPSCSLSEPLAKQLDLVQISIGSVKERVEQRQCQFFSTDTISQA